MREEPVLEVDHLVVAARTLDEGAAWIESRLGMEPAGGGRHVLMGTHNRLLAIGAGVYLEVIAVDPDAAPPSRPRWFSLDAPAMRERLQRGPALVHWVASTDDIVVSARACPVNLGEIVQVSRGDYSWRMTIRGDGSLPAEGIFPTLIQWESGRPAAALPHSGCRLESLDLAHPSAASFHTALRSMGLATEVPRFAVDGEPRLTARIRTPAGLVALD